MSFILDALKKSDAKRRAQLGPDLTTPTAPAAPVSRRHSRPIIIWGLVGLVGVFLIAVSAVVWFVADQDAVLGDTKNAQQVAVSKADAVDERVVADPNQSNRPPEANELVEESVATVPNEVATTITPPQPAAEQTQSAADTPSTSQPLPVSTLPEPDPTTVEALETRLAAASEPELQAEAVGDVEDTAEMTVTESLAEVKEPEEVWQPKAADYLYQWELPLAVRQSLPTLNLLVHVYSNLPEDRFVLINGTRFREGDEVSPGVRLAEIRPEGALIDFRDYRFLLSQ